MRLAERVRLADRFIRVAQERCPTCPLGQGLGAGRGQEMGLGRGLGYGGQDACTCTNCGHEMPHLRGVPCASVSCPECGAQMGGRTPPPNAICREVNVARRRVGAVGATTVSRGQTKISYSFAKSIGKVRGVTKKWRASVSERLDENTMKEVLKDWKAGKVDLLVR